MFDKLRRTLEERLPFPKLRAPIRQWRKSRPFLAGVLVMLGGAVIILYPLAPLPVLLEIGMTAIIGVVLGLVLIIGGLFFWFMPGNRVLVSLITAACSVASLVVSNLGGFVIGMMLGIIGSCLAFGWVPDKERARRAERRPRKPKRPEPPAGPRTSTQDDHPWPAHEPDTSPGPARR